MNRHAEAFAVTDLLAPKHMVANLHQRGAGRADVLLQGDHHLPGDNGMECRHAGGHFLIVFGVDASKKQAFHDFTSI